MPAEEWFFFMKIINDDDETLERLRELRWWTIRARVLSEDGLNARERVRRSRWRLIPA